MHLVANGDCLMMTTIAHQLKQDEPGCHLTWATSYKCKQVIENNPDIDTIWEITYSDNEHPLHEVFPRVKMIAEERKAEGEFDEIIYSQIFPDNLHHYDGTTRSSTFRAYPHPVTVEVSPIVHLTKTETVNVSAFAADHSLSNYRQVILCECAPASGQSAMTVALMLQLASDMVKDHHDILFIISSHIKIDSPHPRIIDASVLTYRENAELSKYCHLLLGCSSGITWLLTSPAAKKLNTVQFLTRTDIPFRFASVVYDFNYWGLSAGHIMETSAQDPGAMGQIVRAALENFEAARNKYHETFQPTTKSLAKNIKELFRKYSLRGKDKVAFCMKIFFERNEVSNFSRVYIHFYRSLLILKINVKKSFYRTFRPSHPKASKY